MIFVTFRDHLSLLRLLDAAELGRKQGKLPLDLSLWTATGGTMRPDGTAAVTFYQDPPNKVVTIDLRFLNWAPEEPVQETIGEITKEMKIAA